MPAVFGKLAWLWKSTKSNMLAELNKSVAFRYAYNALLLERPSQFTDLLKYAPIATYLARKINLELNVFYSATTTKLGNSRDRATIAPAFLCNLLHID